MTSVPLSPNQLPNRLQALGWGKPVYVRGAGLGDQPAVAIVGARAATRRGMDRAHMLARHLTGRGFQIISGGALGIDGAAHRGALAARGPTTVVLGSGADVLYPTRHAPLFTEILAAGGTLASLLPDGTLPRRGTFPQRNPLIAALSDLVIVVEADVRSGSLSTAAAARRFGRPICAWPGSRGCDLLLADGAGIIESTADADLALVGTPRRPVPVALDPVAAQVRDALVAGVVGVDELCRHTGLAVRAVLRALPLIDLSWIARKQ